MNKQDLIEKIKGSRDLSNDEQAFLINLVNSRKKYGLVWETKVEDVEEELRSRLPVLTEMRNRAVLGDDSINNVNHLLIEGDNLPVLTALNFTHSGSIDLIYIDPPYNTKNKDFKYNDTFVDKEDAFRHSKWLSFMSKRLELAKKLLAIDGVIFISIDDNEQSQLKLLCDEIFGEVNYLQTIVWQKHAGGGNDSRFFAVDHEYVLAYCKSVSNLEKFRIPLSDNEVKEYKFSDEHLEVLGKYKTKSFKRMRPDDPRPGLQYEIEAPDGTVLFDEWKWEQSKFQKAYEKNKVLIRKNAKNEWAVEYKLYLKDSSGEDDDDSKQKVPRSLLSKIERNSEGKKQLGEIFPGKTVFNNPKPLELVQLCINTKSSKNIKILDFFAGSGTTLHAAMALNESDGGNRQCILVTNNENNICEEITYERNKRLINGYKNGKGTFINGLKKNNLRYFKSEFLDRDKSIKNKRQLTNKATSLLCIKEDCYNDITRDYVPVSNWISVFSNQTDQFVVIYDDLMISESIDVIKNLNAQKTNRNLIKVYVFSNGQYPYTEDFEEVLSFITLCALPDAIYKAYQNVLPNRLRVEVPDLIS